MGALSKTKELCQSRNVTIRTLESDLGFGNGYIGNKTKDDLPFDRVVAIAEYFDVPLDYFTADDETGENKKNDAPNDAVRLYSQYLKASPEIQAAIETLLRSQVHDS